MSVFADLSTEPVGFIICIEIFAALFLEVLHSAIRKTLRERTDDIIEGEALQLGSGWLHIQGGSLLGVCYPIGSKRRMLEVDAAFWTDQRNIPALGRIGDPDDIIASVRVEEGRVRFPTHVVPAFFLCYTLQHQPHNRCSCAHADGES